MGHSKQNGVEERLDHTLVKKIIAMLLDAKLPLNNLHRETEVQLLQWVGWYPTKHKSRALTSVWLCPVHSCPRMNEESGIPKPDDILLGYGSMQKGYRLFNLVTWKILHSRNVKRESRPWMQPTSHQVDRAVKTRLVWSLFSGKQWELGPCCDQRLRKQLAAQRKAKWTVTESGI